MLARRAALLLAVGHCLAMVDRNLLAVAATPMAAALGLKDGALGLVLGTAFAVPYAAAAVPLGRLADGGRARLLLVGGAVLWTLASLLTGLTRAPAELAAARVLLGVGQAAFVPAALALLTSGGAAAEAGRLALFTGASSLGRSLALLGGGAILAMLASASGSGWRWLFVVTAAPNLLLIGALLATRLPAAAPTARAPSAAPPARLLFLAAACAPIVAGQAAIAWMPTLFVRVHGLTPAAAAMLAGGVALVAGPAGQLLGGWLARHWSAVRERPLVTVAVGLWGAVPPLVAIGWTGSLVLAGAGLFAVNLALGIASFAAIFGWQGLWPAGGRGLGNGAFMATITLVGVGAGPLLAGAMSEAAGGGGAALAQALVATGTGAAGVATLIALLIVRRPRPIAAISA